MRNLSTYIEYLLMTRHYCYVPGHGAYMMSDEVNSQEFMPLIGSESQINYQLAAPRRIVKFSPILNHDDGILSNLLMEAEGISFDEANRYIKRQIALLPENFNELASLHTDVENYGFETISLETWSQLEAKLNPQESENDSSLQESYSSFEIHKDTVSIPKYWIKRAAISLLIAIFFFSNFIGLNVHNDQMASVLNVCILQRPVLVHQTWDENLETTEFVPSSVIMTEDDNDQNNTLEDVVETVFESEDFSSEGVFADFKQDTYFIIVASTNSDNDAYRVCNKYLKKEFDETGILEHKGLYRVFLNSFVDKTEATNYLRSLRKENESIKAWVLPIKEGTLSYIIKNKYNDNQLSLELSHPNQRTERDKG